MPYRIERSLQRTERDVGKPLYAKYQVLKDRLFTQEYAHWATAFPGGNDHGPGHIDRVLEKLDQLIDGNPKRRPPLRPYELFLAMVSILYHDIGMLRGRAGHADTSALLIGEERNEYLIDPRDRDVISAAVVSHSSSKDIVEETAGFAEEELIGGQSVRPRVIASLVRLADELDEDFRRADPELQRRLNVPEESRFFWEFCQRINGIKPDLATHDIYIDVRFAADDVGRDVVVNGRPTPFVIAFGDKLAKINRERRTVNAFLPEALRYRYLKLSVKPLSGRQEWIYPREFMFGDNTSAEEFVAAFPELLAEPANGWPVDSLPLIQAGDLDQATVTPNRMEHETQSMLDPSLGTRLTAMTVDDAIQALGEILSEYIYEKEEAIRIVRRSKTPVVWSGDQISFWDKVLNNAHRSSRMIKLFISADEVLGQNPDWERAKQDYLSACEADGNVRKREADDKGSGVINIALNKRYLSELGDALGSIAPEQFRDLRISDERLKAASRALLAVEPMAVALHAAAEAETRQPRRYKLQQADYALATHNREVAEKLSALQKVTSERAARPLCDDLAQQAAALLTAYAQAISHVT